MTFEGTFLEQVRKKLGGERGEIFYSLCQMARIDANDPEAALALAVASLYVDARELGPEIGRQSATMQEAMGKFVLELPGLIHRETGAAVTQALDGTVIEVQRMIKDMVAQESSAAAIVRTGAIDDEVKKLRGVMEQLMTERAQLEGLQKATNSGGAGATSAPAAASAPASLIAVVGLMCAICALIGFIGGMRMHPAAAIARPAVHAVHR